MPELKNRKKKKEKFLYSLQEEVKYRSLQEKLGSLEIKEIIKEFQEILEKEVCLDIPNALWSRKKHMVNLLYEEGFNENKINTKARTIQMNDRHLALCQEDT